MVEPSSTRSAIIPTKNKQYTGHRGCRGGRRVQKKKRGRLDGICNLENIKLNNKEVNILNAGLKCAANKPINTFSVYNDVHKYIRKINMKRYFLGINSAPSNKIGNITIGVDSGLKNKSLFNPPQPSNKHVEVFKQMVLKDVEKLIPRKNVNSKYIEDGLKSLESKKDVIIRPADKGGGVVILDNNFYHSQLNNMLLDTNTYQQLKNDLTAY